MHARRLVMNVIVAVLGASTVRETEKVWVGQSEGLPSFGREITMRDGKP